MKDSEPVSTREATEILVKTLNSNYTKAELKQKADNATQLVAEEWYQLLRHLEYFEDLFGGTLGDWDIDIVNLELNQGSRPFNCKYYPLPRIKKETFLKDLYHLLKMGVLTPVQ